MTHPQFLATLSRLGWSVREFAVQIGRSPNTVTNWTRPRYSVPADVAAWLERRLAWHERAMRDDPPPK